MKPGTVVRNKNDLYLRPELNPDSQVGDEWHNGIGGNTPFVCQDSICTVLEEAFLITGPCIEHTVLFLCKPANIPTSEGVVGWVATNKVAKQFWDFNLPLMNKKLMKEKIQEDFTIIYE